MTPAAGPVVIGIGNEFRRDDGIGPAIVALLADGGPTNVRFVVSDGEPSALLEAWQGAPLAVVVDAMHPADPVPGRVHRVGADALARLAPHSTHHMSLVDAVRLAEVLGRSPGRLVVYAVEVGDVGHGPGLSPAVARCVADVARLVRAELSASGQHQRGHRS